MLTGTVKEVKSGDSFVLTSTTKTNTLVEKNVTLSGIISPRLGVKSLTQKTQDEPFAFDAREFIRKLIIGKQVQFKIDANVNGKEYATIFYENTPLQYLLLQNGLAKNKNISNLPNAEELERLENHAKRNEMAMWSEEATEADPSHPCRRPINYISSAEEAASFYSQYEKSTHTGIVEYIRDPTNYVIYFPTLNTQINLLLNGVSNDGLKSSSFSPLAAEAKTFVDLRLLQRELQVRIEGADDFGNIIGSLVHPRANVATLLLEEGFAKILENRFLYFVEDIAALRRATEVAQKEKKRRWAEEKESVRAVASRPDNGIWLAKVLEIVSADCLLLQDEKTKLAQRVFIANIRAPKGRTTTREAEPGWFEGREYLRQKLIGKRVRVKSDYTKNVNGENLQYVSVFSSEDSKDKKADDKKSSHEFTHNVAIDLIEKGLVTLYFTKEADGRSSHFDELCIAFEEAKEKKIGLNDPIAFAKRYPAFKVNDVSIPANVGRAKAFESNIKGKTLTGIVESVVNGGRMKVRIPNEGDLLINFSLQFVQCLPYNREEKKDKSVVDFGEEAFKYSRENLLQREVTIKCESIDKYGCYFGYLYRKKNGPSYNQEILEQGLGTTYSATAATVPKDLLDVESVAQKKKIGVHTLEPVERKSDAKISNEGEEDKTVVPLGEVCLSHFQTIEEIYLQRRQDESKIESLRDRIDSIIHTSESVDVGSSKVNQLVLLKDQDGLFYRAKVTEKNGRAGKAQFIDFGNFVEFDSRNEMRKLSGELAVTPALAQKYCLAGLLSAEEFIRISEGEIDAIFEKVGTVYGVVVGALKGVKQVVLTAEKDSQAVWERHDYFATLNFALVKSAAARVNKHFSICPAFVKAMEACEKEVKSRRLGIWVRGDVRDQEEREDMTNRSRFV